MAFVNGIIPYKLISLATTNSNLVDAGARGLYAFAAYNVNASARFVKLYDINHPPTVGTDVPFWTICLPGNATGAGSNIPLGAFGPTPAGIQLQLGLGIAITGGIADSDATAVGAGDVVVNLGYR